MAYELLWDEAALFDLKQLDRAGAKRLVKKVEAHMVQDPLRLGKPLHGEFKNLYRYRVGDYRVIYEVRKQQVLVIVVKVGHRKDVYE